MTRPPTRSTGPVGEGGGEGAARRVRLLALRAAAALAGALPLAPQGVPGAGPTSRARMSARRERLLVMRPDHLGDLLMATAVLRDLRHRQPDVEIWALVGPWAAPILAANPDVDRVLTYPFPWFDRGAMPGLAARYAAAAALATWLRSLELQRAIILRPDHWWGALAAALARVPERVGYGLAECAPFLTCARPPPGREHAVVSGLRLVGGDEAAAARPGEPATRFELAPHDRGSAARLAVESGLPDSIARHIATERGPGWSIGRATPYAVLHPGASSPVKRWPAERWAALADRLADRGLSVVLAGGPGDQDEVAAVGAAAGREHHALRRAPALGELGALLAGARLGLGVDSAPMHLATAVGTSTLRLYGPGDELLYGPWGDPACHVVVRAPGTRPDLDWFGRQGGPHPSMLAIELDQVQAAADRLLATG